MNETQLFAAARTGAYPTGTTAKKLGLAKGKNGRTALHVAAELGNLPSGTTVQDLIDAKDDNGTTALELMLDRQFKVVLEASETLTLQELREIVKVLPKRNSLETGAWLARELQSHKRKPNAK